MHITTFTPTEFKKYLQTTPIVYSHYQTHAGTLHLFATEKGIFRASFTQPAEQYPFVTTIDTTKLLLVGTDFQIKVWQALLHIPEQTTCSYQEVAHAAGYPRAWRAVANAVGQNNIAFFVPCHRVIRKSGQLGGYHWGIEIKKLLLKN